MDNFQIYEEIGRGKFSIVYKARKRKTIQYSAVKCVDKFHKQKVVNEVKILNMLDHPNILKFYNWYETSNHYWIIIDYCSGGDLMKLLTQDHSLPEETVRLFGTDIVNGLQNVHSKGIVFCDLKPSNILIDGCGVLKLSDFGLAKQMKEIEVNIGKNGFKKNIITPPKVDSFNYMAPELFQGGVHSIYSDFWSLGCILYELASGSPPFVAHNFESLVDAILNQEAKPLHDFSSEFNDLVKRLLRKLATERITWDELGQHPFWKDRVYSPNEEEKKLLNALPLQMPKNNNEYDNKLLEDQPKIINVTDSEESNVEKEEEKEVEEEEPKDTEIVKDSTNAEYLDEPDDSLEGRRKQEKIQTEETGEEQTDLGDLYKLLTTESDSIVKPIISNNRIERITEPKYDKDKLGFTPYTLDDILKMSQSALETYLTTVYHNIGGQTIAPKRLNVLCYFETLCADSQSANLFINSSLMKLFVKLLKGNKSPMLRCRLCSVMGLLIRYATYISSELINTGIFDIFLDLLDDNSVKVKRRAIACIGELLFYVAAQEENKDEDWTMPTSVVPSIIACLKSTDEIVQHYAVKTVENITAQNNRYTQYFTTTYTVQSIIKIFNNTQNEYLRESAISSLSRISRHKSPLSIQIIESIEPKTIVSLLKDNNIRVQQSALNIINFSIIADSDSKECQMIINDSQFAENMMELMEFTSTTLKGKALATFYLMTRANHSLILNYCENRFCALLDRMFNKEKDAYVRKCLVTLIESIGKQVIPIMDVAAQALERKSTVKHKSLTVVLHIMTTPCMNQRIVTTEFINSLAKCMQLLELDSPFGDFTKTLLLIIEALSQQQVAIEQHRPITSSLLPSLVHMIESESGDIRFLCLKIFTDILVRYLNDSTIYNSEGPSSNSLTDCTQTINEFITKMLLPRYKFILEDQDPIPLYGLKLLNNIAEHNANFVNEISKLELVPKLFEFFELEHRNNNVHNVRLILKVIAADVLEDEVIYNFGLVSKLNDVLHYAFTNGVDTFFEPCLGIVDHLLYRSSRLMYKCQNQAVDKNMAEIANQMYRSNEVLINNLSVYLELCCHTDISIAETSAHVLLLLAQQYSSIHEKLISTKGLPLLRKGLLEYLKINQFALGTEMNSSFQGSVLKEKHCVGSYILKLLLLIAQSNAQFALRIKNDDYLQSTIRKLASSEQAFLYSSGSSSLAHLAKQIEKLLPT